jgi:hypothetical protein
MERKPLGFRGPWPLGVGERDSAFEVAAAAAGQSARSVKARSRLGPNEVDESAVMGLTIGVELAKICASDEGCVSDGVDIRP